MNLITHEKYLSLIKSNENYIQIPITTYTDDTYVSPNNNTGRDSKGDERNYRTLVDWAKGTYIEEVLNKFNRYF